MSAEFLCPICLHIVRDPVLTSCGHWHCKACLEEVRLHHSRNNIAGSSLPCPQCRTPIGPILIDVMTDDTQRYLRNQLLATHVKCQNAGCSWEGVYCELETHEDVCPDGLVTCSFCSNEMTRAMLSSHQEVCNRRPVNCPACNSQYVIDESPLHEVIEVRRCDLDGLRFSIQKQADVIARQEHTLKEQQRILEQQYQFMRTFKAAQDRKFGALEASLLAAVSDKVKANEVYRKTEMDQKLMCIKDEIVMEMNKRASSYCTTQDMCDAMQKKVDSSALSDFVTQQDFRRDIESYIPSNQVSFTWDPCKGDTDGKIGVPSLLMKSSKFQCAGLSGLYITLVFKDEEKRWPSQVGAYLHAPAGSQINFKLEFGNRSLVLDHAFEVQGGWGCTADIAFCGNFGFNDLLAGVRVFSHYRCENGEKSPHYETARTIALKDCYVDKGFHTWFELHFCSGGTQTVPLDWIVAVQRIPKVSVEILELHQEI